MTTITTLLSTKDSGDIFWVQPEQLGLSGEAFNVLASEWERGRSSGFVCLSVHRESQTSEGLIDAAKLQKT